MNRKSFPTTTIITALAFAYFVGRLVYGIIFKS